MKKLIKQGTYVLNNGDTLTRTNGYEFRLIRKPDKRQAQRLAHLSRKDLLALAKLPCYDRKLDEGVCLDTFDKDELIAYITARPPVLFHLSWALTSEDPDVRKYTEMIRREVAAANNDSTKTNS